MPAKSSSEDKAVDEGFVPSAQKNPLSRNFRSLFSENKMALEWETFELDVLRDIIDSQSTFHVTMDRNEVHLFYNRWLLKTLFNCIIIYLFFRMILDP